MGEKCNATKQERERMFSLFPDDLSLEEREQAEQLCNQYLFYHPTGRSGRLFYCTACAAVWADRKGGSHYAKGHHNDPAQCPRCRSGVTMKAAGKLRGGLNGYPSLDEYHTLVLFRRGEDGALLISAGLLEVRYRPPECPDVSLWFDDEDPRDFPNRELCFYERRRYYMAPGKLAAWRRICGTQSSFYRTFGTPVSGWWSLKSAGEPAPRGCWTFPQPDNGAYYVLGWDCLSETDMRYSAVEQAFPRDGAEFDLYRGVVSYLGHYTRKPQLEMLVKLGHHDVVDELLYEGSLHGLVNWRARNPQKFFRLSRASYRAWTAAGGHVNQLRLYQALSGDMTMEQLMGYPLVKSAPEKLSAVSGIAGRYRLDMGTVLSWLETGQRAQLWTDYVDMGEKLKLDFTRRDVLMPKDLAARHDAAAATLEIEENGETLRKYRVRRRQLVRLYSMEAAGYVIRVPETAAEIVAEGRALCHCVGGYAPRHMEGKVTILFLRSAEEPDKALCTIEMNGTRLVQIHGFRNELDGGVAPQERYRDFLDLWLPWVETGSPRDQQGRPMLPERARWNTA